jgi:hypothetical protein
MVSPSITEAWPTMGYCAATATGYVASSKRRMAEVFTCPRCPDFGSSAQAVAASPVVAYARQS